MHPGPLAPDPGEPVILVTPVCWGGGGRGGGGGGGEKCATGSKELKGTQAYPLQFGAALAAEFKLHMAVAVASATQLEAQAHLQQYDPPASAAMPPAGDIGADRMPEGGEELWCNPDWMLMGIVSGQPDMWRVWAAA